MHVQCKKYHCMIYSHLYGHKYCDFLSSPSQSLLDLILRIQNVKSERKIQNHATRFHTSLPNQPMSEQVICSKVDFNLGLSGVRVCAEFCKNS